MKQKHKCKPIKPFQIEIIDFKDNNEDKIYKCGTAYYYEITLTKSEDIKKLSEIINYDLTAFDVIELYFIKDVFLNTEKNHNTFKYNFCNAIKLGNRESIFTENDANITLQIFNTFFNIFYRKYKEESKTEILRLITDEINRINNWKTAKISDKMTLIISVNEDRVEEFVYSAEDQGFMLKDTDYIYGTNHYEYNYEIVNALKKYKAEKIIKDYDILED